MKELSKELRIISIRNGVEISVERERIETLLPNIEKNRFFEISGEIISTKDIVGIFTPQAMEDVIRRKNGQWKDKNGIWRDKGTRLCPVCGNVLPFGKQCGNCG
jgi:hypothetical protein